MARAKAAAGSVVFLLIAPGVVAGLVPWWLTRWESRSFPASAPIRVLGALLLVAGSLLLLNTFARFVLEGIGTPAPVAPTAHLVAGGIYRYVRNPMYLAVAATIVGQSLLLGRFWLLLYAAAFGVAVVAFVRLYEEPNLAARFGNAYEAYRRSVPGWLPRRRGR